MRHKGFLTGLFLGLLIAGLIATAQLAMSSEVVTQSASTYRLRTPNQGTSTDGTYLDWGTYLGIPERLIVTQWQTMRGECKNFQFYGYDNSTGSSGMLIHNSYGTSSLPLLKVQQGASYSTVASIFTDGSMTLGGNGSYDQYARMKVNGNAAVTGGVILGSGTTSLLSTDPIIRPKYNSVPSLSWKIYGDLTYDSDADAYTGNLSGGSGAWIVFESPIYPPYWRVLKKW